MTGDRSLREFALDRDEDAMIKDAHLFLAQPDSLMVSSLFAGRSRLRLNNRLRLEASSGPGDFVVRGILKSGRMSSTFAGNLAIMDVYSAQHVFGRGHKFDRIDLNLAEGTSVEAWQAAAEVAMGAALQVEMPATCGKNLQSLVQV